MLNPLVLILAEVGEQAAKEKPEACAAKAKQGIDQVLTAQKAAEQVPGGILAGLLFIALGFVTGWLFGGPDADTKRVMALGTGQRNIAAALVVASQGFSDPKVVVMVIVVAIAGLIILMPLSRALAAPKM